MLARRFEKQSGCETTTLLFRNLFPLSLGGRCDLTVAGGNWQQAVVGALSTYGTQDLAATAAYYHADSRKCLPKRTIKRMRNAKGSHWNGQPSACQL